MGGVNKGVIVVSWETFLPPKRDTRTTVSYL